MAIDDFAAADDVVDDDERARPRELDRADLEIVSDESLDDERVDRVGHCGYFAEIAAVQLLSCCALQMPRSRPTSSAVACPAPKTRGSRSARAPELSPPSESDCACEK